MESTSRGEVIDDHVLGIAGKHAVIVLVIRAESQFDV